MAVHAKDTRTALIEAALLCFAEHGFNGTSIRMIANRAGRPLSLIGHHFGCKDGLYVEVFKYLLLDLQFNNRIQSGAPSRPQNRIEAVRQFREQVHLLYTITCQPKEIEGIREDDGRRLWLMELRDPRPEILQLLKGLLAPWVEQIRASICILRPDLQESEINFLGTIILSEVTGHGLTHGINEAVWGKDDLSLFKRAELITEFALNGLGAPSGPE